MRYTVTATGTQTAQSESEDQQTTLWETHYPVHAINVMAGEWSKAEQGATAVYYHAAHDHNVETLLDALVASRRWYSEWFYPYPWGALRINEFPNLSTAATAYPTNISFSEGMGFLTRPEPGADLPYIIAAHEAAHQWWGHLVAPEEAPGADLLTEAMANYATIRLLDVEKGTEARNAFLLWLEERYLAERRVDTEESLRESTLYGPRSETVVYNKGAWVLWMMHQYLGEARMDAALQAFMRRYALHTKAQPGLSDFLNVVRAEAQDGDGFDRFVAQWIDTAGVPEIEVDTVKCSREEDTWVVHAVLHMTGPFQVELGIGVGDALTRVLLEEGLLRQVSLYTQEEPDKIMIDPELELLMMGRNETWDVECSSL